MLVAFIINTLLLFGIARRLLGVPVGWGRVLILSALIFLSANPVLNTVAGQLGLTPTSPPLAVVLVALAVGGSLLAAQFVILAALEAIIPTSSIPTATTLILGFPAAMRRLRRYFSIWWIAVRHGLTAHLGPAPRHSDETFRAARSLRLALTDAGVTFVKFGQMLATRADIIPPAIVKELSKLHSQVAPAPWEKVQPGLEEALGKPIDEVFATLDQTPMAAASVAQIYSATLADDQPVVVKVQRPGARAQVRADLDILDRLAHRLERQTSWGRKIGTVALAQGFAHSLNEELDYTIEVRNMRAVAAASDLIVPKVNGELSSEQVIVMERIVGGPLSSAAERIAKLSEEQRAGLARELLSGVLKQIFVTGVFHADLHPGNVILTRDNRLALLDFGSVGRLDKTTRTALILLLAAVDRQDSIAAADTLIDLMDRPDGLDDRQLERDLGEIMVQLDSNTGELFAQLLNVVVAHGFRVPPQLAAVFRTMASLDGTLRLLDPSIDLVGVAREHSMELAQQLVGRDAVRDQLEHQLVTVLPAMSRLPRRISRITEQLTDGTLKLNVSPLAGATDRAYLASLGGQISLTVLASVLGIGGLFLVTREGGPLLVESVALWPILGAALLIGGLTLGARVVTGIFYRSER